ncbi:MAG: tetratricopeptide repeat protein [Deltaproteobacteria bacterium]|nr:tetratricopeptide repeat protein [Deltaproteobacteria bacterium]MCW5802689.1 tetratricopeptide repeat protein [Deltaproteobacteria bacterium]
MKIGSVVLALCAAVALAGCPNQAKNDSLALMKEANEAYGKKNYDAAIPKYEEAVGKWADNHTAHYGLSGAQFYKKNYVKAAEHAKKAVNIEPTQAMYQLWAGRMSYEKAKDETRKAQAKDKDPGSVDIDFSHAPFDEALGHLQEAVKLNNELWRAHFLIGNIYFYQQKPKDAAAELTKALESAPKTENTPWIQLAELYRQWDYPDAAIQVAQQGVQVVLDDKHKSDLYYEIGAGYDEKNNLKDAVTNYKLAIDMAKDNHRAKFMLGQALYKKGDYVEAKTQLEAFSKSSGQGNSFFKDQAGRMLLEIQMKQANPGGVPSGGGEKKLSPEDMVKKAQGAKK